MDLLLVKSEPPGIMKKPPSSLCHQCRLLQLKSKLLRRDEIKCIQEPVHWRKDSCRWCWIFFQSLTADQRSRADLFSVGMPSRSASLLDRSGSQMLRATTIPIDEVRLDMRLDQAIWCYNTFTPVRRPLALNTVTPFIHFNLVRSWLKHFPGRQNHNRVLRTTFIKVIHCESRTLIRLPVGEQYVTLNYVWGTPKRQERDPNSSSEVLQGSVCTPDTNMSTLPTHLPQTIEDAIKVCSSLGFQYLWVDRYCMPQDSHERVAQIRRMDQIYSASSLTLVACDGGDPYNGLTGVTRPRTALLPSSDLQILPTKNDITSTIWASRGWTFQEALLSDRKLYFTERQLVFENSATVETELAFDSVKSFDPELNHIYSLRLRADKFMELYWCIEQYSRRSLSFPGDTLDAMLGVFSVFQESFGVRHLWGIPFPLHDEKDGQKWFVASLYWVSEFRGRTTGNVDFRREGFPSYSWTSCNNTIRWPCLELPDDDSAYPSLDSVELLDGEMLTWKKFMQEYRLVTYDEPQLSNYIHLTTSHASRVRLERQGDFAWLSVFGILQKNGKYLERSAQVDTVAIRLKDTDVLVGIHFPSTKHGVLVVRDTGEYWERIAVSWEPWDNVPAFSTYATMSWSFRLG